MLLPMTSAGAGSGARTTSRALSARRSSDSRTPTCSTIPVNIAQVSFHSKVRPEPVQSQVLELPRRAERAPPVPLRRARHRQVIRAQDSRRIEQKHLAQDSGFERRPVEPGAGLQQHAQDFAPAELYDHSAKIGSITAGAQAHDLDASLAQGAGAPRCMRVCGEDQYVAICGAHEL